MKYRYYVHNRKENVGITEFATENVTLFAECLCDCINWFMFECDDTLHYEFYVHYGDNKFLITFSFDNEDNMVAYFCNTDNVSTVYREDIRDFVKSRNWEV